MLQIENNQLQICLQIDDENDYQENYLNYQQIFDLQIQNRNQKIRNFFSSNQRYNQQINAHFSLFQSIGARKSQEDTFSYAEFENGQFTDKFYGIFDGHGSEIISQYLCQIFPHIIFNHEKYDSDIKQAIEESFNYINQIILQKLRDTDTDAGSTANIVLVQKNQIILINLGDSQSVIIKNNGKKIKLNELHNTKNLDECKRVDQQGGFIFEINKVKRVQGQLQITRSFGHKNYYKFISCVPDIKIIQYKKDLKYLIMASDGFWDQVDELINIDEIYKQPSLVYDQIENNQGYLKDNLTILITKLQ